MPIRPELRKLYRGPAWAAVRSRILERARIEAPRRFGLPADVPRCEQCGKPNHRRVWVYSQPDFGQFWSPGKGVGQKWRRCSAGGTVFNPALFTSGRPSWRRIRVVLTLAHLNHVSGDDRDENLKALCQWCHLNYDKLHHKETRCQRKDAARPLLTNAL